MPTKNNRNNKDEFILTAKLIDDLPQDMDIIDEDCKIVYLNKSLLKKVGKTAIGKKCYEVFKTDKKQCVTCPLKKPIKVGEAKTIEVSGMFGEKICSITHKGMKINDKKYILEIFKDITERKNIEEELMQYKFIIEQSSQEMAFADFSGKIIFINDSWAQNHGYKKKELIGKNLAIFHYKKDLKAVQEFNKILFKNGRHSGEIIHKRKNGSTYRALMNNFLLNVNGKPKYMVGTAIDITERKIMEEKNKRLSNIIEKTFEPIALIDLGRTNILNYVNPAWEKMFGYKAKEVVGKKTGLLIDAVTQDSVLKRKLQKSVKEGKVFSAEMVWQKKSGKMVDVEVFSVPIRDEQGNVINWFNTIRDVTERKRVEKALQRSEKRYRRLFETAKDSILILNAYNGKIVDANPFIRTALGYSLKELVGKEIWQISPFRNIVANKKKFLELKKAKYVHYENLPLETKTGELKHVEFVSNVYGVNGEQVVQCNIRDITERYNIAQALLESEEKHRLLYETSPDAIMTLGLPLWKFTSGNFAIRKMFGVKNEKEFIKFGPWDLSPKYQPDGELSSVKAKKMIGKAMKEGSNYFEWTHKRVNGDDFFATVLLNRVYFKGKFILQARVQDIGELKLVQKALIDSEEKYRTLAESSPDCIKLFGLDGRLLYMNKGGLKEHRLKNLNEALKKNWSAKDSIENDYHEAFAEALEYAKKGKSSKLEIKHNPKYSIRGICLESIVPVKDNKGNVTNIFAISHDITDIKQAEAKILDSQQKLTATLNGMGDGLFVVDKNENIILFNHTASVLSGFVAKEVVSSHYNKFIKFIFEKDNLPGNDFVKSCLDGGKTIGFVNHTFLIQKNKKRLSVSTNASPLKDKDGNVVGVIVLFRDVSREWEIDQMKSEFVSLASHQLKTPLTGIKWFSELLLKEQSGNLNEMQKDYIQRVYNSNERLINLVNDLLDVSHIDTGKKFEVVKKSTDIVKIVNDVLQDKVSLLNEQKINIVKCAGAPASFEIWIDENKMRQVFDNLISNAVKYSRIGGKVELGCEEKNDGNLIISIKDNGIGIPKYQQKRVFSKFFRGDNAITAQTDGTGLGLYIAKAIVEAHGGEMWFESEKDKGTTFYFSLPINNF